MTTPLTSTAVSEESTSKSKRQLAREAVDSLAKEFNRGQWSNGDLARLRRLEIRRPDLTRITKTSAADITFSQVLVHKLEPDLIDEQSNEAEVSKWITIIQGLARVYHLHNSNVRLGTALHRAGISDKRLSRLVRAGGFPLWLETRRMAHYLVSEGQSVDWADAADLILSEGKPYAAELRRKLAGDFKRERYRSKASDQNTEAKN